MKENCDICGDGEVSLEVEKVSVSYNGQTGQIDSEYLLCDSCGSEHAGAEQLRANKRSMLAFKKEVDGFLSGEEIREIRSSFNLSAYIPTHQ